MEREYKTKKSFLPPETKSTRGSKKPEKLRWGETTSFHRLLCNPRASRSPELPCSSDESAHQSIVGQVCSLEHRSRSLAEYASVLPRQLAGVAIPSRRISSPKPPCPPAASARRASPCLSAASGHQSSVCARLLETHARSLAGDAAVLSRPLTGAVRSLARRVCSLACSLVVSPVVLCSFCLFGTRTNQEHQR